ncbi:leucine-rich repeat domain-containing protein, partial [Enterococcus faecalis]|nr:leucine-rich repeat domain-containing protein [Enterococcus faecalis]
MKYFFSLLCSLFIFWNVTTVFADSNLENGINTGEVSEGEVFTQNDITYKIIKINDGKGEVQVGDGEHTLNNSGKTIVIPSVIEYKNHLFNVTEIGSLAFAVFESEDGHTNSGIYAEKVTIPNTVKKIQKKAFFGSNVLKEIEFEKQSRLNVIDDQAFNFSSISKIDFPKSLEYIGTRAFDFAHLTSISFSNNSNLQIISHGAFAHNDSLESVVLPDNLEQMGEKVFEKSKNLKSIEVSDKNSYFSSEDGVLFDKKKERLILYPPKKETSSYKTPETVKVIEEAAFALNENYLKELKLNEGLVEIKPFAFQRNLELKKVDLPNSVSKIGKLAFYDNWKLEDIKIPSSVEELSPYTLYNVPKLKCIEFGENIKTIPENFIGGILEELQTVKVASRDHFKITATSFPVNKIDSILFMVPNEDIAKEMTKVGINREKITIASETTEPTSNTESSKATESTSSTESSEATEPTSSTKSSEATESTSSTESSEATEPTSSTESSETTEPTSSTESSKATESTSSTESSEAMGIIGSSRDKLKTTKNRIENKNLPKTGEQRNLFLSSVGGI